MSLYSLTHYIAHFFRAYNTTGEGIHSPYLFYLVSMITREESQYYIWRDIEALRLEWQNSDQEIDVSDYGTGRNRDKKRKISTIATTHLENKKIGQLFFRWLVFLGQREKRALQIVELGTSLGITTAYLATANAKNKVTTFEGCPNISACAKNTWKRLNISNIEIVTGNIDSTLSSHLPSQIDFAFIDANHTYEATMRYFKSLLPLLDKKSIVFIDDIHQNSEMGKAWQELKSLPEVSTSMDFFHCGALFFDQDYIKKHYRIKL